MMLENLLEIIKNNQTSVDEEYIELFRQYQKMFGSAVPTEMIPDSISDEKLKEAVRKCVSTGNNTLLEDLDVEIDERRVY